MFGVDTSELVLVAILALIFILVAPILGNQLFGFMRSLPTYVTRLQQLAVDEGNQLLDKYAGAWRDKLGLAEPLSTEQIQKSVGDLVTQGA